MLKLTADTMNKAIERAKTIRPMVRVISADERTYSVTGSRGDAYTVKFVVVKGLKLAECNCKAGQAGMMCFHVAGAAQVNVMVQSMRLTSSAPVALVAPAPAPSRIERRVEWDRSGVRYTVTRIDVWAI